MKIKLFGFLTLALITFVGIKYSIKEERKVLKVKALNQWPGFKLENMGVIYETLKDKYDLIATEQEDYDLVFDGVFGNKPITNQNAIKNFFTGEALPPKTEGYDLSIGFDYIDKPNYLRIPLAYYFDMYEMGPKIRTNYKRASCQPKKPYFACFLVSNGGESDPKRFDGCLARNRLFHKLSLYKRVESGGPYLNNLGKTISRDQTLEWLSGCKFIIAYENQTYPGYITEKPFQAYLAGSVPLYYADKSVSSDINKQALIFAPDFSSEDELVEYIKMMDNDDELYCKHYNQPIITDPALNYEEVKKRLQKKLDEIFAKNLRK